MAAAPVPVGGGNVPYAPGTTSTDPKMEACIAKAMGRGASREAALAMCNVAMYQRKRIAKR